MTNRRQFSVAVVRWQKKYGRHHLPWQMSPSPYSVWLSEIMLQQTQATTVIPYYQKFIRRWTTLESLARAKTDSIMAEWSGLGYYARARNLHAAAKIMQRDGIPTTAAKWQQLPGVGKSTAAAIAVFAFGECVAILDGNVKRVLARFFALQTPINTAAAESELWQLAESVLPPPQHIRPYTQGMMDLGALICTQKNPNCQDCPLANNCAAKQQNMAGVLPHRKKPPPKPHKYRAMALIHCGNYIFLEKRPPSGIWGGLWALPENTSPALLKKACEKRLSGQLIEDGSGEFSHSFTHYHLHAQILIYQTAVAVAANNGNWIHRRMLQKTALPSPLKKYIGEWLTGG